MALQQMLLSSGAGSLYSNGGFIFHGEGTNGGTVFTDSSLNNASVTRTGSAITTSTTQFRAGASSIFVNATTANKLQLPNSNLYRGTGVPWTFAASIYATNFTSGTSKVIYDGNNDGSNTTGPILYISGTTGRVNLYSGAQSTNYLDTGAALTNNAWNDLMWTWDGTTLRGYLNGTLVGSTAAFTNGWGSTAGPSLFGDKNATPAQCLNGYADEVLFVRGQALQTGASYSVSLPFPNA